MLLFRHRTERSAALSQESRPSGSAQELPALPEASPPPPPLPPESSPSLETLVNLADAMLSDVVLQPGSSLSSCSAILMRHVQTVRNYASIMLEIMLA